MAAFPVRGIPSCYCGQLGDDRVQLKDPVAHQPVPCRCKPPVSIAAGKAGKKKYPDPEECMQCGTTRTSQWRDGPYGRKTLCDACGAKRRRAIKKQQQDKNAREPLWDKPVVFLE